MIYPFSKNQSMPQISLVVAIVLTCFVSPTAVYAAQSISDNFDSYTPSFLNGLDEGGNWTSPWITDGDFEVQSNFVAQGQNAVKMTTIQNNESFATRTFSPLVKGKISFSMAKDTEFHAPNFIVRSGNTIAMLLFIGSDNQQTRAWYIREGNTQIEIAPYTLGSFDQVDIQFDLEKNRYRASVSGGPYTQWFDLVNQVDSVDSIQLHNAVSGEGASNLYWDDIEIK